MQRRSGIAPIALAAFLASSCDVGETDDQANRVHALEQVYGVKIKDMYFKQALKEVALREQCDTGDGQVCRKLADELRHDRLANFAPKILVMREELAASNKGCDHGEGWSCVNVGTCMLGGYCGLSKDPAGARRLLRRGCDLGDQDGCCILADLLREGRGGERNEAAARAMFEAGCNKDHARSCGLLGEMQVQGRGGPEDKGAGTANLTRACSSGYKPACDR